MFFLGKAFCYEPPENGSGLTRGFIGPSCLVLAFGCFRIFQMGDEAIVRFGETAALIGRLGTIFNKHTLPWT